MYSKYLSAYIEQTQLFFSHLEVAKTTLSVEAIHEMRVAVKKIRSLYRMFKVLFPDTSDYETGFKYLRKIFKSAADIRDSHVMTELIKQYKTNNLDYSALQTYFRTIENGKVEGFFETIKETKSIAFKTSFEYIEKLKNQDISSGTDLIINLYVRKKISELSSYLQIAHDEKSTHKFRIKFKEINFLLSVKNNIDLNLLIPDLKISASELGIWHDKIILSYHLTNFIENSGNNKNLPEYLQLQKLIMSESKNEAEKILIRSQKKIDLFSHLFDKNLGL